MRSGGRVVEGARLESEYTPKAYRGFESLPLRQPPPSLLAYGRDPSRNPGLRSGEMVLVDLVADPQGEGRYGERWVDPERTGHDRPIGDIEPLVDAAAAPGPDVERLA